MGRTSSPSHTLLRFKFKIGHKLERRHKCGLRAMPMGGSTPPSLKALETLDFIAPTGTIRGICFPPVVQLIGEAPLSPSAPYCLVVFVHRSLSYNTARYSFVCLKVGTKSVSSPR